jgi:hypothetical protein
MPAIIPAEELRIRSSRLMAELRAERDIARQRLARACWQRDACLMLIAGMLLGLVIWRWS